MRALAGVAHALGATIERVAALEQRRVLPVVHRAAVRGSKSKPAVCAVEDDLVVAHVDGADDGAVVLVIENTEAPHALPQLVRVLSGAKVHLDAIGHVQRHWSERIELRDAHSEAVVIAVFALNDARCAVAPRAMRAKVVADLAIGGGRQVHECRPRVDDGAAVVAGEVADRGAADADVAQVDVVRGVPGVRNPLKAEAGWHGATEDHGANLLREAHREDVGCARGRAQVVKEGGTVGVGLREAGDAVGDLRVEEAALVRLAAKGGTHGARTAAVAKVEDVVDELAADRGAFRVGDAVTARATAA